MRKIELTLACEAYDRTDALREGRVTPEGIDLVYLPLSPQETFWRMLRHLEFDAVKSESNLAKHGRRRRCSMKAREFDAAFDDNEVDIVDQLDLGRARRPGRDVQRVNVDFPTWMVASLDAEATRLGITRQAIIKTWIAERLDHSTT